MNSFHLRRHIAAIPIGVNLALVGLPVLAADLLNLIPSSRWIVLRSPAFPTSYEECNALALQFSQEIRELNAQHDACLANSPGDPPGAEGCSKASCQPLHSARDMATRRSSTETGLCRERVGQHLAKEREEARRRQLAADEAQRIERERTREEADRLAKREAERQSESRERSNRDAQLAREREARDQRDRRDRESRDQREREAARERSEREAARATAEREAVQARVDREARERAQREQEASSYLRAQAEVQKARAEAEKRARDTADQSTYLELIAKLKEAKDSVALARDLAENPFGTGLDLAANAVANRLIERAIDVAAPIGAPREDSRYEVVASVTEEVRSRVMSTNPFAAAVSGLAMEGVHQINRRVLGQLDEVGTAIAEFGRNDIRPQSATSANPRASLDPALATGGGARSAFGPTNPFVSPPAAGERIDAAIPPRSPSNPFSNDLSSSVSSADPFEGRSYEARPGHTLYRNPETGTLSLVAESLTPQSADDDRQENGQLRCSATGKGRVLAECERRRRAGNPFASR